MSPNKIREWFEKVGPESLRGKNAEEGLQLYAHEICKYIHPAKEKEEIILDLGCGDGETTYRVAQKLQAKIIGIDFARAQLEKARRNYGEMEWIQAAPSKGLPFKDEVIDKIFTFGFLQYFTPDIYIYI